MSDKDLSSLLAPHWKAMLQEEFQAPYMDEIRQFLKLEYKSSAVYPPKDKIFRALKLVDYPDVRVVVLGQDPYHGPHQANGLAFAVSDGERAPPSLQNIFKEVAKSIEVPRLTGTTLEGWARQGVLLLNTVLTVRANSPMSHRGKGWELFTDKIIKLLNEHPDPIVFLLWGGHAQSKKALITNDQHLVLFSPHPSPLSAHRGFLGNKHFLKANSFLSQNELQPIDWALID